MSEERRVAELETAMVRASNKLTVLENENRAQKENIAHVNARLVKLMRECVDFATRLDKLESESRFTRHNIWSRLLGWHRDR